MTPGCRAPACTGGPPIGSLPPLPPRDPARATIRRSVAAALVVVAALTAGACASRIRPPRVARGRLPDLEAPYETPEAVLAHFGVLERAFAEGHDGRGPHITSYLVATEAVVRRLGTGFFRDDAWVRRAIVCYGNRFRESLLAYEHGAYATVPHAWYLAHEVPLTQEVLLHQALLLGIVAHIRDLTLVLEDVGVEPRDTRQRDYHAVDRILCEALGPIRARLARIYSPAFAGTDPLGRKLTDAWARGWVVGMRARGWRQGVRLACARTDAEREAAQAAIDQVAWRRAQAVLGIPRLLRGLEPHRRDWVVP